MASPLNTLAKAFSLLLSGPEMNEPRKGTRSPIVTHSGGNTDGGKIEPRNILSEQNLHALASQDDVIVALRRVLRNAIGEMPWKIAPDIDAIEGDVKRWKSTVELNLQMPGLHMHFEPQAIHPDFFAGATGALRDILREEEADEVDLATSRRVHDFFENVIGAHKLIAESHTARVRDLFMCPNPTDTWRDFIGKTIDELTLYDACAIVKNPKMESDEIGEIYLIPGNQVRLYRRPDLNMPAPPYHAYDWSTNQRVLAYFNSYELSYLTANPQINGYGISPLESIVRAMFATIYSDNYLLDFFQNNNVPPGVFDLGPNVDPGERDAVEKKWNNEIRKGLRRVMFVSMQDGVKGWLPIPQPTMRENEIIAIHDMWVKRKCAVFGLSPNDIGNTQDMHLANSEQQAELTQSRGVMSLAKIVETQINADIVHGKMWRRNNPWDINDPSGYAIPVFPFKDVKFEFAAEHKDSDTDRSAKNKTYWEMGVLSPNEIRKSEGLPAIPGGDTYTIAAQVFAKVEDLPNLPAPTEADAVEREPDGRERTQHPMVSPARPQALPSSSSPAQPEQRLKALANDLAGMIKQKRT